jgi:hypothetical protein
MTAIHFQKRWLRRICNNCSRNDVKRKIRLKKNYLNLFVQPLTGFGNRLAYCAKRRSLIWQSCHTLWRLRGSRFSFRLPSVPPAQLCEALFVYVTLSVAFLRELFLRPTKPKKLTKGGVLRWRTTSSLAFFGLLSHTSYTKEGDGGDGSFTTIWSYPPLQRMFATFTSLIQKIYAPDLPSTRESAATHAAASSPYQPLAIT